MFRSPEEVWMALALQEAEDGLVEGEPPIGAAILDAGTGRILARAHEQTRTLHDPTAHAVMIALTQLSEPVEEGSAPRTSTSMVVAVTREPCLMCAGAILQHPAIQRILIGSCNPEDGAFGSRLNVLHHLPTGRTLQMAKGILAEHCDRIWTRRSATV